MVAEQILFNHTDHKKLWNWLAENPGKKKADWPGWKGMSDEELPLNLCFACSYLEKLLGFDELLCSKCPLVWENSGGCMDGDTSYFRWLDKRRPVSAKEIRDLPLRPGVFFE